MASNRSASEWSQAMVAMVKKNDLREQIQREARERLERARERLERLERATDREAVAEYAGTPPPAEEGLLASDAEREDAVTHLRAAYQDGRLTAEELDEREGRVLAARRVPALEAVLRDLPKRPTPAYKPLPVRPSPMRPLASTPYMSKGARRFVELLVPTACVAFCFVAILGGLLSQGSAVWQQKQQVQDLQHLYPELKVTKVMCLQLTDENDTPLEQINVRGGSVGETPNVITYATPRGKRGALSTTLPYDLLSGSCPRYQVIR